MKNRFLANLLLTFIWLALTGNFTYSNFLFGFLLSYFILSVVTRGKRRARYFRLLPKVIAFIFYFLWELLKANLQVAYEVMTPGYHMTPAIIKYPLKVQSDLQITFLANLITLTPGTLSLDVSDDKKVMYIHTMYLKDRESFINGIKNGFEKRILEIVR